MYTDGFSDAHRRTWHIMGTGFVFSVKAAESASLYLSNIPDQLDTETIRITLGDHGNEVTIIERADKTIMHTQEDTPGILDVS